MDGFFGWSCEHGAKGWYATKIVDRGGYGGTGIVRMRRHLVNVRPNAPRSAAEKEIRRLYVVGVLQ